MDNKLLYEITVPQFKKMLQSLEGCLEKGAQYAQAKKFDFEVLLNTRLAPDQFPLARQIQIACDNAKYGVARLTGKEAPKHEDKEKTFAEFKERIARTIAFLDTVNAEDFRGADERRISLPYWGGKHMMGFEYIVQYAIPNFCFHVVTAYSILRNNGVDVGKLDYLGPLPLKA